MCIYTYTPIKIPAIYLPSYVHTCRHNFTPTCLPTCLPSYIHWFGFYAGPLLGILSRRCPNGSSTPPFLKENSDQDNPHSYTGNDSCGASTLRS